jgi:hypothetical protein
MSMSSPDSWLRQAEKRSVSVMNHVDLPGHTPFLLWSCSLRLRAWYLHVTAVVPAAATPYKT